MQKKIKLDDNLFFVLALYEDGSFQKGRYVSEGFVMLIDLGRHRNTIMTNPQSTFNAIKAFGYYWEECSKEMEGDYIIIDDDYVVHNGVKATENDFLGIKEGELNGIILQYQGGFTYMNKKGEFINI